MVRFSTISEKMFSEIRTNGVHEGDNLTYLRNKVKSSRRWFNYIIGGYDHIDDRATQDFFHLDQESIWSICLKRSFKKWVIDAFKQYVNPEDSESDVLKYQLYLGNYMTMV